MVRTLTCRGAHSHPECQFGGFDDDDDGTFHPPPGGILSNLAAQLGGGWAGPAGNGSSPNPRAYDEYMKAYSVAMLPGKQRDYVSYGGKSASILLVRVHLFIPLLTGYSGFHSNSYFAPICIS